MKILGYWLEFLLAALLIYLESWALLALAVYIFLANLQRHRELDHFRAAARWWQTINEVKLGDTFQVGHRGVRTFRC